MSTPIRLHKAVRSHSEILVLLALSVASILLQWSFVTPEFNGADSVSHFRFAQDGQDWGYWLNPEAFNGNYFPMGYGSFLALMLKVSGGSLIFVQILQVLMGLSLAWCGWFIVRSTGRATRLSTFGAIALSPSVIGMSTRNGYEIVIALSMMFTLTVILSVRRDPSQLDTTRWILLCLAGLTLGLGALFQSKILVVLPVFLIGLWRVQVSARIFFFLLAVLPLSIWGFRNYFVLGTWNPTSGNSGMSFWQGNNWSTILGEHQVTPAPLPERFSSYFEGGFTFIISQPEAAYGLQLRKVARLLEPYYLYPEWNVFPGQGVAILYLQIVLSAFVVVLFVAYVFGRLWVKPPQIPAVGWQAATVLAYFWAHLPFLAEQRYLGPAIPIAITVAVPTAFSLFQRFWSQFPGQNQSADSAQLGGFKGSRNR